MIYIWSMVIWEFYNFYLFWFLRVLNFEFKWLKKKKIILLVILWFCFILLFFVEFFIVNKIEKLCWVECLMVRIKLILILYIFYLNLVIDSNGKKLFLIFFLCIVCVSVVCLCCVFILLWWIRLIELEIRVII